VNEQAVASQPEPVKAKQQVALILGSQFRKRLGVSKVTMWRLERDDPRFPRPVWIRNCKAFVQSEADGYLDLLISERDANGST
jgi:predicted DNA-binding transcriptional regulator AlpA